MNWWQLRRLASKDPSTRSSAVLRLATATGANVLPALGRALGDPDRRVQREAAVALARRPSGDGFRQLAAVLLGPDTRRRRDVTDVLRSVSWNPPDREQEITWSIAIEDWASVARFGSSAIPALSSITDHAQCEYHPLRKEAVRCLGLIGDPSALPALTYALGRVIRGAGGTPTLIRDPDDLVRKAAADALGRVGGPDAVAPLVLALEDREFAVCEMAIQAIGKLGELAVPRLVQEMAAHPGREAIAKALVSVGPGAVASLVQVLDAPDAKVRCAAIQALGRIGDMGAVPHVLRLASDADAEVRASVAAALGSMSGPGPEAALVALLDDSHVSVQREAAKACGAARVTAAVDLLLRLLNAQELTAAAAEALGWMGDRRATKPLLDLLPNATTGLCVIIRALGNIGDPDAGAALVWKLEDNDQEQHIREAAAYALGDLGDPGRAGDLISATVIAQTNTAAVRALERLLTTSRSQMALEDLEKLVTLDKTTAVLYQWDADMEMLGRISQAACDASRVTALAKEEIARRRRDGIGPQ